MTMNLDGFIAEKVACAVESLYGAKAPEGSIQPSPTRKEFEGDVTVVTFPLLRISRKSPEATAEEIGAYLKENLPQIESYNVVKGFLNLKISPAYWCDVFSGIAAAEDYGQAAPTGRTVMVEFSSPNTNKPLHLGHIRNNLLGWSVSRLLEVAGKPYEFEDETLRKVDFENHRVITVTCHRRENLGENMVHIFSAIRDIAAWSTRSPRRRSKPASPPRRWSGCARR